MHQITTSSSYTAAANDDPYPCPLPFPLVQTLELLAKCAEIRNTMWHELGLVLSLNTIIEGEKRWSTSLNCARGNECLAHAPAHDH